MTSTRSRACDGKAAHATRQDALDHLYRMVRSGAVRSGLNAYRCGFCGCFHVGHVGRRGKPPGGRRWR